MVTQSGGVFQEGFGTKLLHGSQLAGEKKRYYVASSQARTKTYFADWLASELCWPPNLLLPVSWRPRLSTLTHFLAFLGWAALVTSS